MRLYSEHETECWWSLTDTLYDEYWIDGLRRWMTLITDHTQQMGKDVHSA